MTKLLVFLQIQNKLEEEQMDELAASFEEAYLAANQGLTADDIDVTVTIVDNTMEDQNG